MFWEAYPADLSNHFNCMSFIQTVVKKLATASNERMIEVIDNADRKHDPAHRKDHELLVFMQLGQLIWINVCNCVKLWLWISIHVIHEGNGTQYNIHT